MKRQPFSWLLLSSFIIFLSACSPNSALLPVSDSRIIKAGSSFGQSITAQNTGLSAVSVLLAPAGSPASGSLLFHLRANPQSKDDLARARLPLSAITQQTYYKFDFSPQSDSRRKDYFLEVDVEDEGQVQIYTAPADSYLDGALYENQIPQEAQLGFRLEYDRQSYLIGLSRLAIEWIVVLGIGGFIFILPGWALFSLFWRGWDKLNWGSKIGLSGGLSLAIYPLLLLWTDLVGLHLGLFYAWLPPIAGLLFLVWKNRNSFIQFWLHLRKNNNSFGNHELPPVNIVLADIAFIVILGLVIISRLWVIRSLDVPLFGDSYQHSMITQLIIDHDGLFDSWKPYADLTTFTYHFGFHSAVAIYHWISGVPVEKAMLWTGQLINILAILGLYPLALKIGKNRWAGVLAMLIGGLLSPMPMSYVNWGRYTQLVGQVVLPAVIWTSWSLLERPSPTLQDIPWVHRLIRLRNVNLDFSNLVIVWLAIGGIALTHYRILILVILFFPTYALFKIFRKTFIILLGRIAWIGTGSIVLFTPWFIHVFSGKILKIFAVQITTLPSTSSTTSELLSSIGNLSAYLPVVIWIIFLLCMVWGLWKRNRELAIFIFWWLLIILATNPNWIGLPGTGAITNFAILIAFYIPASIIIGATIGWILSINQQGNNTNGLNYKRTSGTFLLPSLLLVITSTLGLWALPQRIKDLNIRTYALVTRPDLRAMDWIKANTSADARFLINSFSAFGNTSIVGSDAGWWLPLLALRQSSVPPLTYAAEQGITPDYGQSVSKFYNEIKEKGISSPDALELLKAQGINYIYIGQRQGRVNYSGFQILDPQVLIKDQHFQLIYHEDRVWLFIIRY
jgi:hypothetical protein